MTLIKEPIQIDFYFDGKEMTTQDQKRVSDFIAKKKTRKSKKTTSVVNKKSVVIVSK